jgi:tRNA threonylcarbamoyladenosine biosynthesis protein TsaE
MAAERSWRARSPSPEVTEAVGEALGAELGPGAVVALCGELGAGKTTFVRGLARGLGSRSPVVSPTFTRMRELPGRLLLRHFDAWRTGSEALFAEGGEHLGGDGVAAIEWADRVTELLPRPRLELRLRHAGEDARELELVLLRGPADAGPVATGLERRLERALEAARATAGLEARDPGDAPSVEVR